ncbi:MAG TPA: DUF2764 family protein [Kiritimatiellia bacterium]|nr:DUF2764 family protein [Kiritimatiellia bacterium]
MPYYYLTASLPGIEMEAPPPFSAEEFRAMCVSVLEEKDLSELDCVLEDRIADGRSVFCREYAAAETQLRNALARARAGHRKIEASSWLRDHPGFSVAVEKAVTDAWAKAGPLERERVLDRHRWQVLEDLALTDSFGLPAVLSFAARLKLAGRWAEMTEEKGQSRLAELLTGLTANETLQKMGAAADLTKKQTGGEHHE